jgi:hypothetical protein
MHPDLTIAVALDRHLRRAGTIERRSARVVDGACSSPARSRSPFVPDPDPPIRQPSPLRLLEGGVAGPAHRAGAPSTGRRPAA